MTGSIACTVIYSPMEKEQREMDFPWETSASVKALISRVILMQASVFNKSLDVQGNSNGNKCNLHYRSLPRECSTMKAKDLALKSLCILKIP